ncbi:hypothetical protein Bbelb_217220 [Branchiostoma belcheri]|nr:hypothetical protein Bbelb_217220 [Branchiostoma belcheri]
MEGVYLYFCRRYRSKTCGGLGLLVAHLSCCFPCRRVSRTARHLSLSRSTAPITVNTLHGTYHCHAPRHLSLSRSTTPITVTHCTAPITVTHCTALITVNTLHGTSPEVLHMSSGTTKTYYYLIPKTQVRSHSDSQGGTEIDNAIGTRSGATPPRRTIGAV